MGELNSVPGRNRDFSSRLHFHTAYGTHAPASQIGTGKYFPVEMETEYNDNKPPSSVSKIVACIVHTIVCKKERPSTSATSSAFSAVTFSN